ncbi:MAG: type 1 glutamine amidotransferase [Spirochaetales bacterium]|nr:type 1 glutamine amidotransferase [Spirochaetales bacterium]
MRIHVLQHEKFETEAAIGYWAAKKKFPVTRTLLFKDEPLPDMGSFDLLCIMGGGMNIYEEDKFPFLKPEKEFLKAAIAANKKILGICLGAQLLADAFGARVKKNPQKEIGWFPVHLTKQAGQSIFFKKVPGTFHAFHWHGDTFDLPADAVHCASSPACTNQIFTFGNRICAIQFHLEMTWPNIKAIATQCADEIIPGEYIQTAEIITEQRLYQSYSPVLLGIMEQICDTFQKIP